MEGGGTYEEAFKGERAGGLHRAQFATSPVIVRAHPGGMTCGYLLARASISSGVAFTARNSLRALFILPRSVSVSIVDSP